MPHSESSQRLSPDGPSSGQRTCRFAALVLALFTGAGCQENSELATGPEVPPALATRSTAALPFRLVSAGSDHSCGVTSDSRAFCWGSGSQLTPVAVHGGLRFLLVSAGLSRTCGVSRDNRAYCWTGTSTPIEVPGGRRFRQVSVGAEHVCGTTTSDVGFCWGANNHGQLGTGGASSEAPVRIAGGLRFQQVDAGGQHSCGTTTDDKAYCWGDNISGQLGDGTRTRRPKPVPVAGDLRFAQVLAGGGEFADMQHTEPDEAHTCGITKEGKAYCWGNNTSGQLGNGTSTFGQLRPVAVAGARRWRVVSPGWLHTCGVTVFDVAYCWGGNTHGKLGNGSVNPSSIPVRVAGALKFNRVSASLRGHSSCGTTTDNRAYCWGWNSAGQLGDGTRTDRSTPVPVAGTM